MKSRVRCFQSGPEKNEGHRGCEGHVGQMFAVPVQQVVVSHWPPVQEDHHNNKLSIMIQ